MITTIQPQLGLEEFLKLPETKPASEFINGEITQKPMPQGEHSLIQVELCEAINQVAKPGKFAYAFPELRCTFAGGSIVPDISVFRWERIPRQPDGRIANRFEIHPDWAIEILSPEQNFTKVLAKLLLCSRSGTELGWLINRKQRQVEVYRPDKEVKILKNPDTVSGENVLPGFVLDLSTIW